MAYQLPRKRKTHPRKTPAKPDYGNGQKSRLKQGNGSVHPSTITTISLLPSRRNAGIGETFNAIRCVGSPYRSALPSKKRICFTPSRTRSMYRSRIGFAKRCSRRWGVSHQSANCELPRTNKTKEAHQSPPMRLNRFPNPHTRARK